MMGSIEPAPTHRSDTVSRRYNTIVIGGGQTGLATAYHLKTAGIDYVVLDASHRIGDAWRNRWDSLRLFTQARMNGLPGMAFPATGNDFVSKDQVADFLESYAETMELNVLSTTRVERLSKSGDDFLVETDHGQFTAPSVIVAMADYQKPKIPEFASDLDPGIVQMHSSAYRNPGQLADGAVLVVGFGNSGADIAIDVAPTHETTVAGHESSSIPFALESWFGRHIGTRLVRFGAVRVLNTSTPIGRKARPKLIDQGPPLVRVRPKDLKRTGVERVGRISGTSNGKPVAEDGRVLDVNTVIWCTGYRTGFDWIDLDIFDESGRPIHDRGIVAAQPGLYFLGLYFLHALWSETIPGMKPDAIHVTHHLTGYLAQKPAI